MEEHFDGMVARWNATDGHWADVTSASLVHDLITGPDGDFSIEDEYGAVFTDTRECASPTDGKLEGDQCSFIREYNHVEEKVCDLDEPHKSFVTGTEIRVKRHNSVVGPIIGDGMMAYTKAKYLNLEARWYDSNGQESFMASTSIAEKYDGHEKETKNWSTVKGTCGYGYAEKDQRIVEPVTRVGTAPSSCPAAP